jgi:hypothetical protein
MNRVTDVIRGRISDVTVGMRVRFSSMLDRHLPERTKRLLFLASFSAQLKAPQEFNREMLHKLNKMLDLSADDAALKFPIHISRAIWRNRPFDTGVRFDARALQEQTDVRGFGMRIVSAMPKWLRYGDDSKMVCDVERLLRNWQQVGA